MIARESQWRRSGTRGSAIDRLSPLPAASRRSSSRVGPAARKSPTPRRLLALDWLDCRRAGLNMRQTNEAAGRSAAWLARLPWEQEVTSSNLVAPIQWRSSAAPQADRAPCVSRGQDRAVRGERHGADGARRGRPACSAPGRWSGPTA